MREKGRSPAAGFYLGFFLGLIGVVIAAALSRTPEAEFRRTQQQMNMMDAYRQQQTYQSTQPQILHSAPARPQIQSGAPAQLASPAQWVTDPFGRHQLRYYDGNRWTEHVSDHGVTRLDPPVPAATGGQPQPFTSQQTAVVPLVSDQRFRPPATDFRPAGAPAPDVEKPWWES